MDRLLSFFSYGAGGSAIFLGLNIEQWGIASIVIGIAFVFITYFTNLYFKIKKAEFDRSL